MVKDSLSKKNWAVVGATNKKEKFGYKIFRKLLDSGYNVYPVHPKLEEIDGVTCYTSIFDIPHKVDVVNIVVNKKLTMDIVKNENISQYDYLWFQPGTYDEEVIEAASRHNKNLIYDKCVLIETEKFQKSF